MEQDNKAMAGRLRFLRVMSGETQEETARNLNISRSCLANYETGRRVPDAEMLALLAGHFKVNVGYLTERGPIRATGFGGREEQLLELIPKNGILDLSEISPEGRIALLQFYNFLQEK